jgi:hypothetical protein
MSQDQFDALTRRLAASTSRRQMLKALAGGALAAAASAGTVLRFRGAEAATLHTCCVYNCSPTVVPPNRLSAKCTEGALGPKPTCPMMTGCVQLDAYFVAKCSACGF